MAIGDDPAVAVGVDRLAVDCRLADKVSQRQRALQPAAPCGAVQQEAFLALFGGVDAVKPDLWMNTA